MNQTLKPSDPLITTRKRWRISLIWLVPLVAAAIGASMLIHAWLSSGPQIAISFQTAAGLEAGKTQVKYKDVVIGIVKEIALREDHSHVVATVELDKSAEGFASAESRFWVVRPRIGSGGVSGIDTMLSGAYIGADTGQSKEPRRDFIGLETPPTVITGMPGKTYVLHSDDLGSLDIGSPVYFQRIPVGRVASYQLGENGIGVNLQVFIDAPYDRFVTTATRFWNAGGLDVSLGSDGFKLRTQSLATVIAGGIAFSSPEAGDSTAAQDGANFTLADDQKAATAAPDGEPQYFQMRFDRPLRGLAVNAPVEFLGMDIGRVAAINLDIDPTTQQFSIIVDTIVYPRRFDRALKNIPAQNHDEQQHTAQFVRGMVERGLRAQARNGNLLTGQLYIALDFVPNAPKVNFDVNAKPLMIPTISGGFDKLQEQLASIVGKLDKVPLESIGRHVDKSLVDLDKTLKQVNGDLLPETRNTLQEAQKTFRTANNALADDSPLLQNVSQTLQEMQRTARSIRAVGDLLGRHPEALIRGRPGDPALASTSAFTRDTNTQEESR